MNIFVRGALFPHWTRKRSGGVVASVSVWMPWTGRVDPNGLVRRGCCERVGWGALDRTSWPERVGPDGLSRACRLGCLGPSEPTRMGWSVHGLDSFILVRDGRSLPAFPCASGRCLPCFVPLSPMPRPHLLAPGRCLPVLRTAAFLCFGLLPSCASDCCLPCFVSLSPMPRPFLLAPRSLPPVAHGPLLSVHGPLPLALLTLPALLPVQKKTPEGLAFGGFRLLSVANYFARAFRLTSLAALSASFGFFEMALLSCASAAVRSPSLTAMTARR